MQKQYKVTSAHYIYALWRNTKTQLRLYLHVISFIFAVPLVCRSTLWNRGLKIIGIYKRKQRQHSLKEMKSYNGSNQ